jgi:hypothetical protein
VTALPTTFLAALDRLRAWQETTGQIDPPSTLVHSDGFRLGAWMAQQRHRYRNGRLAPERIEALESAGITWEFTTRRLSLDVTARWWARLDAVAAFAARTGSAPRVTDRDQDGFNLGDWLCRQREALADQRLTADQVAALDALPFTWRIADDSGRWRPDDEVFRQRVEALAAYAAAHGHANPPQQYRTPDGYALGQWLADQRWYRRQGRLAEHREQALSDLGVAWNPPRTRRNTKTTTNVIAVHFGAAPVAEEAVEDTVEAYAA